MGKHQSKVTGKSHGGATKSVTIWRGHASDHPMKIWRISAKISLDNLSFITGISASSLSRIERGKQTPLIGAAQKIIVASQGRLKPEDFFEVK